MNRIVLFLKDVRVELARVSWPTRRQTVQYTFVVILMSVLVAAFLGAWDGLFEFILNKLLIK